VVLERLKQRGARLRARWPWLDVALSVQRRYGEVNGGYVASAVTLALFLSLFPLLLVALAVVGFFSAARADLAADLVGNLGLVGEAARTVEDAIAKAEDSRRAASVVGLVGLLWTGLAVVAAFQHAVNTVWQVKGRGLRDKVYALGWLAGTAVLLVASFTLTALLGVLPLVAAPAAFVGAAAMHVVLFLWTFHVLSSHDVGWRPLLPGAVLAGVGFQVLTAVGAVYVPDAVASSSALYGSIGAVFAILAWLFFFGRLFVYASVLNVVRFERARGTMTAEIQVPHLPGLVALDTTRGGAINEVVDIRA
jgi:inner membrane protein YhjD